VYHLKNIQLKETMMINRSGDTIMKINRSKITVGIGILILTHTRHHPIILLTIPIIMVTHTIHTLAKIVSETNSTQHQTTILNTLHHTNLIAIINILHPHTTNTINIIISTTIIPTRA